MVNSFRPLAGCRVVEIGEFIAAPFASRLLADAGAAVLKLERLEGDSARREGPFPGDFPDPQRSGLFAYLNRGKRVARLDLESAGGREMAVGAIGKADIVVYDEEARRLGLDVQSLTRDRPQVAVSVTAFGESGPRADWQADDLIVVSAGGLAFATPGFPDGVSDPEEPPLRPNANLGEFIGGLMAALAALAGWVYRVRTGRSVQMEVSKQEALAAMLNWELAMFSYGGSIAGRHPVRVRLAPNHYLPIADGWAAIVAFLDEHWHSLLEAMGNPEWAADPRFASAEARGQNWPDLEPLLLQWTVAQSRRDILGLALERHIPCAPALPVSQAVENEQVGGRQWLVPTGLQGDASGRLPGDPLVVNGHRRPVSATGWLERPADGAATVVETLREWDRQEPGPAARPEDVAQPLEGVRVVDLGQIVAVPLAGQWLAFLGAEVILVESRERLTSRNFAPFGGEPTYNACGIFNHINRGKLSCTINLRTEKGRDLLRGLMSCADVVIENFAPGTMERLGLSYEALKALNPGLVMVSVSACGHTGPWKDLAALHSGVICLSGLASVTGYADGYPRLVGGILPDSVAAAYTVLSVLQGLEFRRREGKGIHIQLAMTELLQSFMPEAILEWTMLGREPRPMGNAHPWKRPHGIYRARGDDAWVAVSAWTEEQRRALRALLGQPVAGGNPSPGAGSEEDAWLEAALQSWIGEREAGEAAALLQAAGIPACKVFNARDTLQDEHLISRGFVVTDRHPVAGERPLPGAPWRSSAWQTDYRHAPLLGDGTHHVMRQLLGLSEEEIAALVEQKVLY
jgi:crotonobetainyl-CoA:carnitine CoA-transferase CaiB-like acyl-CoA transferase